MSQKLLNSLSSRRLSKDEYGKTYVGKNNHNNAYTKFKQITYIVYWNDKHVMT